MKNKLFVTLTLLSIPIFANTSIIYNGADCADYKTPEKLYRNIKQHTEQQVTKSFKELCLIVDQYAENTLKKGNINSLAIAIYKDGQVYEQYYGELDKESKKKPDELTLYEIASISKVFEGSIAAKAVLEQKIKLNDDVRMYLNGDYPNLQFEGTPITIENLLTHTLGLKDKAPKKLDKIYQGVRQGVYENKDFHYNMSDLLKELKTVELNKKPGTFYEYNSVGPELMANILEQVYDKPYKDILQDFLNELDLQDTHLYEYDKYKNRLAISFDDKGRVAPLLKNPLLGGSHGIISTLPDLIKLMQFQLESNNPLIKESTRLLFKDKIEGDDKGYLWDVGYGEKEGAYYGKTGTSNGVQSGILICPDSSYGMIIIMNNNSEEAQDDWAGLYNQIETDLIIQPKINLVSLLSIEFKNDFNSAKHKYKELKQDKEQYLSGSFYLNNFGYELIHSNQIDKAIKVFELALSDDSTNANLYDSLAEAYYLNKDYDKALLNYTKALELDPENENAKVVINKIKQL
ncbi:serine hydrolase [Myroides sp. LJL110]